MSEFKRYDGPRVTKDLPFERVAEVGSIGVYESQVRNWIFSPARILAEGRGFDTDHGMALLTIQLMFFEPHGAYLLGLEKMANRDGELETTRQHFRAGFERFLAWRSLNVLESQLAPEAASIYKWMRCGLFHMSHLSSSIMIGVGPTAKTFFKYPTFDGWLVSPWVMLAELERYFDDYIRTLREGQQPLLSNFYKAYEFFFTKPMNAIQANVHLT